MAKNPTGSGEARTPAPEQKPEVVVPVDEATNAKRRLRPGRGTDPLKVFVGDRTIEARKRLRLTQVQLAERAKMGPGTLFLIENARQNPSLELLEQLAKALEIEVGDLFPSSERIAVKEVANAVNEQANRCQLILKQVLAFTDNLIKD